MKRYIGLSLIALAIVLLLAVHLLGLTRLNVMLLVPLSFLLTGLFLHIYFQKRDSRY